VLAAHRGHGLGLAVKTRMLRWLTAERPDLERIYTSSAASNAHMLRVNRALGFTIHRGVLVFEQSVDTLAATVG
jgi:mycothiol synthase